MNIQLLLEIADAISKHEERFDIGVVLERRECGTVGCISGWARMLTGAHIHRFIQEHATPAELEECQRLQRERIIQPK